MAADRLLKMQFVRIGRAVEPGWKLRDQLPNGSAQAWEACSTSLKNGVAAFWQVCIPVVCSLKNVRSCPRVIDRALHHPERPRHCAYGNVLK